MAEQDATAASVDGAPHVEGGDIVFDVDVAGTKLRVFSNAYGVFHTGGHHPAVSVFDAAVLSAYAYVSAHRTELEALYKQLDASAAAHPPHAR
jgi:hypothetical protein